MLRILSALIALLVLTPAHAIPGPNPHRDWHSADSKHFRINYALPQRAQAERVANIAERVYARLSRELQWEPSGRIEIIVLDEFDIANGYSTPVPFNETAIFLTPPDDGELLDNSFWLELLLTHELTHTFHLDKVRGAPNVLRHIFGRFPLLFPNLWQPTWAIEGIATYNESTPASGEGRLRGPTFEAWMRIEHAQGFKSLSEINADGRALPTSKQYLYGAYFYDFLARRYGSESIYKYINKYSGNVVPRVDTNPVLATGKHMDELWDEFIADLTEQMSRREAQLKVAPRADGDVIFPANFRIFSLAPVPDGVLAVVNDGLLRTELLHIDAQGKVRHLANVKSGAHIDVRADGKVLIAQPDICRNYNFFYDLYTWSASDGLQRKTSCDRYRRAVWLGEQVAALRTEGGVSTLSILEQHEHDWHEARTLYQTPEQVEAVDLAASPDGKHIALVVKQARRMAGAGVRQRRRRAARAVQPQCADARAALCAQRQCAGIHRSQGRHPGSVALCDELSRADAPEPHLQRPALAQRRRAGRLGRAGRSGSGRHRVAAHADDRSARAGQAGIESNDGAARQHIDDHGHTGRTRQLPRLVFDVSAQLAARHLCGPGIDCFRSIHFRRRCLGLAQLHGHPAVGNLAA